MQKQKIKQTPTTQSPVACKKCGSIKFERTVQEDPSVVKIFFINGVIDDEVIREGDKAFGYSCTECETVFTEEDSAARMAR